MLEGIVISALLAYALGWVFLKAFHAWDRREARKIEERMQAKDLIRYGRIRSHKEILDDARSNVLHGWE